VPPITPAAGWPIRWLVGCERNAYDDMYFKLLHEKSDTSPRSASTSSSKSKKHFRSEYRYDNIFDSEDFVIVDIDTCQVISHTSLLV
jgi:hypothetical protein